MAPLQPIVKPVDREMIDAALETLEGVDLDAANMLRSRVRAYELFAYEPWEIKDLLVEAAYRCGQLQVECKDLAEKFERLGRGECEEPERTDE